MMARIRKSLDENQKGFTLVELLVVVIIIGILAAIAIPVYLGQQGKARDSATKADLANAKTALVVQLVEDPALAVAVNGDVPNFQKSGSTADLKVKAYNATSGTFCIQATSTSSAATVFSVKQSGGITESAC